MRDELPKRPWKKESMIINHDTSNNPGTHWSCFAKENNIVYYFDSFGKLPPPHEIIQYLGSDKKIFYNAHQYQSFDTIVCGHLCLQFLVTFYE